MMLDTAKYPRCAERLRWQRANLGDPLMTPFWAAVCVAFDIPDRDLAKHGGFNFTDKRDQNGWKLLKSLEGVLLMREQRAAANATLATNELRALLGARGVRTSKLRREEDYWHAAETLFGKRIKRIGGIALLHTQISQIPKQERRALANANFHKLPEKWRSAAPNHARKLQ